MSLLNAFPPMNAANQQHPNHQTNTVDHATAECIPAYERSQPAAPKKEVLITKKTKFVIDDAFPPINATRTDLTESVSASKSMHYKQTH